MPTYPCTMQVYYSSILDIMLSNDKYVIFEEGTTLHDYATI